MRNILVTGASGFIGRHLSQALELAGHHVTRLNGIDITDARAMDTFADAKIDHVFHLASRTFVPDAWNQPAEFQRVNVTGTVNVLELCRKIGAAITFVSAYLYGIPDKLPIHESDRILPNNPYALSKHMAETVCRFYSDYYALPVKIVRPFNIFGPGQKSHFLIPEVLTQVMQGDRIHVKDLSPRRDYLYVMDLVEALLLTMEKRDGPMVYNIGYGSSLSVSEIVDSIQSIAGTALPVISENVPRPNEIPDVFADISAANEHLGWHPRFEFQDGIKIMLNGVSNS